MWAMSKKRIVLVEDERDMADLVAARPRRKLGKARRCIQTVRGVGYKFGAGEGGQGQGDGDGE